MDGHAGTQSEVVGRALKELRPKPPRFYEGYASLDEKRDYDPGQARTRPDIDP